MRFPNSFELDSHGDVMHGFEPSAAVDSLRTTVRITPLFADFELANPLPHE
jgi:hypothetical protein